MASFPTSPYSPASKSAGQTITASFFNDPEAEITAIEQGYLNGTARLNSSQSTVAALSVAGGSTFAGNLSMASTAVVIGSSSVPVQKVWCGALDVNGTSISANGSMTLLKANSGTTTTAVAENVDTIAMASGLTAKDTLVIYYSFETVTQNTVLPLFYNSTDSVTVADLYNGNNPAAGIKFTNVVTIRQLQSAATAVAGISPTGVNSVPASIAATTTYATFTTAWTGAWTLAFRHGGVTAGGTFKWSWSVFKLSGQ